MKAKPECDACFLRQAADAAGRARVPTDAVAPLLEAVAGELARTSSDVTPPVRASRVHALVRRLSGDHDPYRAAKAEATRQALALYPRLRQLVSESPDPLDTAIRLAIAGNIIDLGVAAEYDLEASIDRVLTTPLAIDHTEHLREALGNAERILYLADNAGETVFDRLLIEALDRPVTYMVKGGPAVNDATREDALAAGLEGVCEIIDNGAATLGTLLNQSAPDIRRRFDSAELVIAKGMANFESLSGSRKGLFFLLQAKCAVIAAHLGVPEKGLVVLEDQPQP